MVAVAIRITFYYIKTFLFCSERDPASSDTPRKPSSDAIPDALSGVNIEQVLKKNVPEFATADAVRKLGDIQGDLPGVGRLSSIREESKILREHTSFDVDETDFLRKDQIIGYDKYLGWLFGVVNILTDTVTTKAFKSYSVARLPDETAKPFVDQEVSTWFQVIYPAVNSIKENKESVVASIVREATELGITNAGKDTAMELYRRALDLEHRSSELASQSRQVVHTLWDQAERYLDNVAINSFINTIVAAVHALMYRSSDGDLSRYAIRTNNIILYSGMIAATVNNIPALVTEDPAKADFGGLISTLLSLFHSTAFWIHVKADFLVNAYKKELAPCMDQWNKELEIR